VRRGGGVYGLSMTSPYLTEIQSTMRKQERRESRLDWGGGGMRERGDRTQSTLFRGGHSMLVRKKTSRRGGGVDGGGKRKRGGGESLGIEEEGEGP